MWKLKMMMARCFSGFFLSISLILIGLMIYTFVEGLISGAEIVTTLLDTINMAVIALATFELGIGIGKEYPAAETEENVYSNVRRTVARFVGVVAIALVLEALMLVIKYSQLELAGNLYYPVAIILGASVLLVSLGILLNLTREDGRTAQATAANMHGPGPAAAGVGWHPRDGAPARAV